VKNGYIPMKKLLIVGSNGMLGHEILNVMMDSYEIYTINRNCDDSPGIKKSYIKDITDFKGVKSIITEIKPDIVVHTAAIVDIEYCEANPEKCYLVNYYAVKNIVDYLSIDVLFVYISSESVFSNLEIPPCETSPKNPINLYYKSKSLSEDYILHNHNCSIIIRTNMYGFHKNWRGSLVEWAINNLKSNVEFPGFHDVLFNPLYTKQIALIIEKLFSLNFNGIIHLGSETPISKLEFIVKLAIELGYDQNLVYPKSIDDLNVVPRNKYAVLNTEKLRKIVDKSLYSLNKGISMLVEDIKIYYEKN
jgi:dTDP-4-dehydrorhamnose reductase